MGGTGCCDRGEDCEDQNGLQPDCGGEIGTSLNAGRYYHTNDFADCHTAADLYATANRHTKANLYPSGCIADKYPAAYAQADSHPHASSDRNPHADANLYANTDASADAHANRQVSAIHQRNSRTTL